MTKTGPISRGNPVRASWSAEALQRLEDVRSGKVKTIPADKALARVRSLLK